MKPDLDLMFLFKTMWFQDLDLKSTVNFWYKLHLRKQWNCWSLRCSWSCRHCSNYIFILNLKHLASKDWAKTCARPDEKHLKVWIWCTLYYRFDGISGSSLIKQGLNILWTLLSTDVENTLLGCYGTAKDTVDMSAIPVLALKKYRKLFL